MARGGKQPEPEVEAGAPEWMVTFSDCMTLLLTFFVLLLTFSSFDDKVYYQMGQTPFEGLPGLYNQAKRCRDNMVTPRDIHSLEDPQIGSEKPTKSQFLDPGATKEQISKEHHRKKIFIADSSKFFWGDGTVMTPFCKDTLKSLGDFLNRIEGKIVICENLPTVGEFNKRQGLERCWKVMKYLTEKVGVDKARISISQASATDIGSLSGDNARQKRRVEIVVLERGVCN